MICACPSVPSCGLKSPSSYVQDQRSADGERALDPNLQLRGVVELLSDGFMFTTTFTLDRRASNVAVFTPSMGLIPYVDVAMTTRVSDNVMIPVENDASPPSV